MKKSFLCSCIFILSSCSFAPTYHRPSLPQPIAYKEAHQNWVKAKPQCATMPRGPWWKIYNDKVLDQLENQVILANQDVKAALARYEQACAAVAAAKSDLFPTITGVANVTRQKTSRNTANPSSNSRFTDYVVGFNLNYELDVWGRVRNSVAAAKTKAEASAADLATINLGLQTELAINYFNLRSADIAQKALDDTVKVYQKSLSITRKRYQGGVVSVIDVDQAKTQLESAKTQAADMRITRAQLEHAIAVLIGKPPAMLTLTKSAYHYQKVTIATDLPSTLLERRPDIAEAELLVQSANYNIGVARAAYFPAFNIASAIGVDSSILSNLFKSSSLAWSLGPTLSSPLLNPGSSPEITQIIIDGGKTIALSRLAQAQYCETVAQYKQTVLTAYKEVENSLVALAQLDSEIHTQTNATRAADRALNQANYRYKGGLITYLTVAVSQNIELENKIKLIDIQRRRQVASVQLIKALGGGFING
jgi:NodT family efflux transporter outer membrane factor (OMF) lipoprotein